MKCEFKRVTPLSGPTAHCLPSITSQLNMEIHLVLCHLVLSWVTLGSIPTPLKWKVAQAYIPCYSSYLQTASPKRKNCQNRCSSFHQPDVRTASSPSSVPEYIPILPSENFKVTVIAVDVVSLHPDFEATFGGLLWEVSMFQQRPALEGVRVNCIFLVGTVVRNKGPIKSINHRAHLG